MCVYMPIMIQCQNVGMQIVFLRLFSARPSVGNKQMQGSFLLVSKNNIILTAFLLSCDVGSVDGR